MPSCKVWGPQLSCASVGPGQLSALAAGPRRELNPAEPPVTLPLRRADTEGSVRGGRPFAAKILPF